MCPAPVGVAGGYRDEPVTVVGPHGAEHDASAYVARAEMIDDSMLRRIETRSSTRRGPTGFPRSTSTNSPGRRWRTRRSADDSHRDSSISRLGPGDESTQRMYRNRRTGGSLMGQDRNREQRAFSHVEAVAQVTLTALTADIDGHHRLTPCGAWRLQCLGRLRDARLASPQKSAELAARPGQ
jgi:hypothetical protein